MEIKITDKKEFNVYIKGRLDTTTAPKVNKALDAYKGDKDIVFDFKDLEYISSSGLRILFAYKTKAEQGKFKEIIKNPNDVVNEVFHATGFDKALTIK